MQIPVKGIRTWKRGSDILEIDSEKHILKINGEETYLTCTEWKILLYLSDYENQVISREKILSECLNYYFEGSERTVDTHIANLRMKLGESDWINTVRGFGYRFNGSLE